MVCVTQCPGVIAEYLPKFTDLFSRPQLRHFTEYLTGLIVCDKANIKQINNCFISHREYSNKDRFIRESSWNIEEVDRRRIELIKEFIGNLNPGKGILAVDDTLIEKTGEKIAEVGKYYDHADGRYRLGHNLVTSQYVTPRGCFPIGYRLYLKRDKQDPEHRTKIELAKELVQQAVETGLRFGTVVFDAWFLAKDLVRFIESEGLNWVAIAKSNRIIFIKGRRISLKSFQEALSPDAFQEMEVDGLTLYGFTKTVKMSKLGKVRLLLLHQKPDLSDAPMFLVTNNLRWDKKRILRIYQSRWPIETFYRDSKQNLGLGDYEMRDLKGIKRHWYLVFLSYTLLTLNSMDGSLHKWIKTNVRTIGEKCRRTISDITRDFILWVLKQNQLQKSANEILTIVFASEAKIGKRFQIAIHTG